MPKIARVVVRSPPGRSSEACPDLVHVDGMPEVRRSSETSGASEKLPAGTGVYGVSPTIGTPEVNRHPTPTAPGVAYIGVGYGLRELAGQLAHVLTHIPPPAPPGSPKARYAVTNAQG